MKKRFALLLVLALTIFGPIASRAETDDDATAIKGAVTVCTDTEDPETCTTVGDPDTVYYLRLVPPTCADDPDAVVVCDPGSTTVWQETNGVEGLQRAEFDDDNGHHDADTQVQ